VSVDYELADRGDGPPVLPTRSGLGPVELFQLYHRTQHGVDAADALTAAFNDLLREAEETTE
jgi:hypothetical protein